MTERDALWRAIQMARQEATGTPPAPSCGLRQVEAREIADVLSRLLLRLSDEASAFRPFLPQRPSDPS